MITVNQEWWEHLTPPDMHPHRETFDAALNRFIATPRGADWLGSALTPRGLIRVSPGQPIPVFHVALLGGATPIIIPPRLIAPGHRAVGPTEMASGRPLALDELALGPEIRFELVTDPVMLNSLRSGDFDGPFVGVTRPAQVFSTPAHHLLKPVLRPTGSFVLYQHIFGHPSSYPDDGWFYVGITTRRWQARWAEHRRAIGSGSRLRFHQRFREETTAGRVSYVHHKIMAVTDDVESLYSTEKWLLEGHWQDERLLNMSPGGRAGRRQFRGTSSSASRAGMEVSPRSRNPRLAPDQLLAIRGLETLATSTEIARRISAGTTRQVRDVVAGRTYRTKAR